VSFERLIVEADGASRGNPGDAAGGAVVIEWGDTIAPALPAGFALLSFGFGDGDDDRHISLTAVGSAWHVRVPGLKEVLADRLIDRQDDY